MIYVAPYTPVRTMVSPRDARLDLTDLYAFPSLGMLQVDLIMNVHPSEGVNRPGPAQAVPFAPEAIYEPED